MRILITNDDGIQAPALPVLAATLARAGHDVIVVAPLDGHSGCGASIGKVTEGELVALSKVSLAGAEDIPAFSVDAPPAFIVLAAAQGVFGARPDVVVTGPNSGLNLGPLTLHSGTLDATVTAASNAIPGVALSTTKRARHGFQTAATFCAQNLHALLRDMGTDCALNINVPDEQIENITDIRMTRFAPLSLVAIGIAEDPHASDSAGGRRMQISIDYTGGEDNHRTWRAGLDGPDETDAGAILDGCISVTVVHAGLRHMDDRPMHIFART